MSPGRWLQGCLCELVCQINDILSHHQFIYLRIKTYWVHVWVIIIMLSVPSCSANSPLLAVFSLHSPVRDSRGQQQPPLGAQGKSTRFFRIGASGKAAFFRSLCHPKSVSEDDQDERGCFPNSARAARRKKIRSR